MRARGPSDFPFPPERKNTRKSKQLSVHPPPTTLPTLSRILFKLIQIRPQLAMEVKRHTARDLVRRLSSAADDESLASAIAEVRLLTKQDPDIRIPLADAGAVPHLSRRLICGDNHPTSQENAAAALLNLSIASRESLMSTPGLLDALATALRLPSAAQHAAATLYSLLSVEAYRPIIGSKRGIVTALISLLRGPPIPPSRTVKDVLKALFGMALYPLNRSTMVEAGVVAVLFTIVVRDGRTGMVEDATAVIAQVAGCYESVVAFRRVAGVQVMVEMVDGESGWSVRARENAASALLNLAMFGGEVAVGDIREVEEAEEVVRELAENGSARAKSKAESLLRILDGSRKSLQRRFSEDFCSTPSSCSSASFSSASFR